MYWRWLRGNWGVRVDSPFFVVWVGGEMRSRCGNDDLTFCRFAMGGLFSTKVHSEHCTLFNHKTVCGARNPAYCKCAVRRSYVGLFVSHLYLSQYCCISPSGMSPLTNKSL